MSTTVADAAREQKASVARRENGASPLFCPEAAAVGLPAQAVQPIPGSPRAIARLARHGPAAMASMGAAGVSLVVMRRQPGQESVPDSAGYASRNERIWRVVAAIPAGRVASYGQVAALAGLPRGARLVGRALGLAPDGLHLPWHRVIAASGRIALPPGSASYRAQSRLLRAEGLPVRAGRIDIAACRWQPDLDELLWGPAAQDPWACP